MESRDRTLLIAAIVVLGIAGRFLMTDLPNFSPVGALALFAGASFADRRIAVGLPLLVMLATDLLVGFHSTIPFVYVGMIIYCCLGMWAGSGLRPFRLLPATLLGSLAFFLITNFGFYLLYYPRTWVGLVECYTLALPFFRNTLTGDLFFGAIMFGCLALAQSSWPKLRPSVTSANS
jgi:hypothetical protein